MTKRGHSRRSVGMTDLKTSIAVKRRRDVEDVIPSEAGGRVEGSLGDLRDLAPEGVELWLNAQKAVDLIQGSSIRANAQ